MAGTDRAVTLYQMMAKRCADSGFSPYQAQVYRELADFIAECTSLEEATEKLKASPYYLAPGAALMKDKLSALERAAEEMQMPDVAQIYRNKREKIEADINDMYIAGYERDALNAKYRYMQKYEAFCAVFNAYIKLKCCCYDEKEASQHREELRTALTQLSSYTEFEKAAAEPLIRYAIALNDEAYAVFVKEAPSLCASQCKADDAQYNNELEKAWEHIKQRKSELCNFGEECLSQIVGAECVVIPPKTADGCYTYTNERTGD